jgi:hypothetical protein
LANRSLAARLREWLAVAVLPIAIVACRREPPPSVAPPPPPASSSAHPEPFVHPDIPAEPPPAQARPECSYAALVPVAARIREAQKLATRALEPGKKRRDRAPRCGSPAMAGLDRQIKIDLADRVRICVGQDGPLDPEWNLLDAALASLGACIDCGRMIEGRAVDCQRTTQRIAQAESDAAKNQSPPR